MNQFNCTYLKLAREQNALSQADLAKQLEVKQAVLSKYENGSIVPSDDVLNKLSSILDYPREFFFQNAEEIPSGLAFHRKRSTLPARICHRVEAEVRARSLDVLRLFKWRGVQSDVAMHKGQSPAEMARELRRYWHIGTGPISNLTALLEKHLIVVLSFDFGTEKLDGFFMPIDERIIAIALNDNQAFTMDRRRHTLAHELGHAVLNHCKRQFPGEECEKEAEEFAAEFLTPEGSIKPAMEKMLTPNRFEDLKRVWGVSMGSLLYRAYALEIVKEFAYRRMWMHFSSLGYRKREPACGIEMEYPSLIHEMMLDFLENTPNALDYLCLTRKRFEDRYSLKKGAI